MAFIFHNIWDVILPIDEVIFFKMVIAPPTRFPCFISEDFCFLVNPDQERRLEGEKHLQDIEVRSAEAKKQDGSHEPECIHVLGLRVQTSAKGKLTYFCMHRALISSQQTHLSNSSQRDN